MHCAKKKAKAKKKDDKKPREVGRKDEGQRAGLTRGGLVAMGGLHSSSHRVTLGQLIDLLPWLPVRYISSKVEYTPCLSDVHGAATQGLFALSHSIAPSGH